MKLKWKKTQITSIRNEPGDFPGGPVAKNPPANAGDMGLIPGTGSFHMPWGAQACAP